MSPQPSPPAPPAARATPHERRRPSGPSRAASSATARGPKRDQSRATNARYPGPTPSQVPQLARRKNSGERRGHAEHKECPDEEEGFAGFADLAADEASRSLHVDDGDGQPKEPPEEDDDVSRSPFGEHQRAVHQTRKMSTAMRFESPARDILKRMSSAR